MRVAMRRWVALLLCFVTAVSPVRGFGSEGVSLMQAVINEDMLAAKAALERGENPNTIDSTLQHAPLHIAVAPGGLRNSRMVQLLAQYKADLDLEDPVTRLTPLMAAMVIKDSGPFGVVEMAKAAILFHQLLDLGADPNRATGEGITPLMLAAELGNLEFVQALLRRGANPNAKDGNGDTALHAANAKEGAHNVKELLIRAGADGSLRNTLGIKDADMTPAALQPPQLEPVPGELPGPSPQTAMAEPAAAPLVAPIASTEKSKWSKWLIAGAVVAAAVVGGVVLAAALDEQKNKPGDSAVSGSYASLTGALSGAGSNPPGTTQVASKRPRVTWETTQVNEGLQYHQMQVCYEGGGCVPVGKRIRHYWTQAVFLTSPGSESGTGWTRSTPLHPSELFPLYKGFNTAMEIAWSGNTKPTNSQIEGLLNDALSQAINGEAAVAMAQRKAQQLAGSSSIPLSPPVIAIRPTFQWEWTIGPIRSYVLRLCLGGSCQPIGGQIWVDANPNDGLTSQGFANGIRWTPTSPVQMAMLDDLRNKLGDVISKLWASDKKPTFDVIENVIGSALATGTSTANVAELALANFARRGFPGTPVAVTNLPGGSCTAAYAGPLDDPQTSTFCRQAYSYSCIGDATNAAKVCNLLSTVLSAYGTSQTAARYCSNYCR